MVPDAKWSGVLVHTVLESIGAYLTYLGVEPVVTIAPTPFLLQFHLSPLNFCMKSNPGLPQQGVHSQIQGSERERETIRITLGLSKAITSGGHLGFIGPCHHLCLVEK